MKFISNRISLNGLKIPEALENLYKNLGTLKIGDEWGYKFNLFDPKYVFDKTGFATLKEAEYFHPSYVPKKIYEYVGTMYCHFGTIEIGNMQNYLVFDKEGKGFKTIILAEDDIYEDELVPLCNPPVNPNTLQEIIIDGLNTYIEWIVRIHEDELFI